MQNVRVVDQGAVRYIKLCNKETKNAINVSMAEELLNVIKDANSSDCDYIVLNSECRAFFSKGPDLSELLEVAKDTKSVYKLDKIVSVINECIMELHGSPKFTIAAIHGAAYGGGFNFTFSCDYRICVKSAKFIENFIHMGVSLDLGASYYMPRLCGVTAATELLISGRIFTGEEARTLGLVHEVYDNKKNMMNRVSELTGSITKQKIGAVKKMKELFTCGELSSLQEQLAREKNALINSFMEPGIRDALSSVSNTKIM